MSLLKKFLRASLCSALLAGTTGVAIAGEIQIDGTPIDSVEIANIDSTALALELLGDIDPIASGTGFNLTQQFELAATVFNVAETLAPIAEDLAGVINENNNKANQNSDDIGVLQDDLNNLASDFADLDDEVGDLASDINGLQSDVEDLEGGVALAIAMANAPIVAGGDSGLSLSLGTGAFKGEVAGAARASFSRNGLTMTGSVGATGSGDIGGGAGIGIGF